ncbi:YdcF family protein [Pendulispora brunnea]|uniref:YdcF family protein n=1 Tax=Pendulispora brunnea TaxID=2905690 RepID=A0ABZ2KBA3_9BACT
MKSKQRWILSSLALLSAVVLLIAVRVDRFGQEEHAEPTDAIVVLGARVRPDHSPCPAARARVEKAVELYRRNIAPVVYFSGGVGDNAPSEAEAMRDYAIGLGLPANAARLEAESHSTEQNAQRTTLLLRAAGERRAVVVSDPYHLLRARQYFRLQGFEVATSPALVSERNSDPLTRAHWTLRESAALLLHPRVLFASAP